MSETKSNPYSDLPETAFWRSAVADKNPFEISGLWDPKFRVLPRHNVATFGSCFAQHIGRALRARRYNWLITESAPFGMTEENRTLFNYGLFTCRTGNIYTTSLLNQWVKWALDDKPVPEEYWEANGRYFDPFRPVVEPKGFESLEEMRASRAHTIAAFRSAILEANIFVFTLGLTESWFNKTHGYEYPMCPGTAAGTYDPDNHVFRNQAFDFIRNNLLEAIQKMRSVNKNLQFILTVSPVPLTATYSKRHVLVATMESKSTLRAVAGQVAGRSWVDYFPSYEIVNSAVFGGRFFESNQRSVSKFGVDFVMNRFFADQEASFGPVHPSEFAAVEAQDSDELEDYEESTAPKKARKVPQTARKVPQTARKSEDVVCEEQLLEAFGERR